MISTPLVVDIIGWMGAGSLLLAYAAVSARRLEGDSNGYPLLNVIGAAFLILNSAYYGAFPSAFLNLIWIGITFYTMGKTRNYTRHNRSLW